MGSFIREQGAALAALGYPICAITPGTKRPIGNGWEKHPLSPDTCRSFTEVGAGVGILCGVAGDGDIAVYGLDFDIEDEGMADELARWVEEQLYPRGEVLRRVGRAPKFLIPVRAEAGLHKQATAFFRKGDSKARLEILGRGQQFVAYAIHPGTGKPYSWDSALGFGLEETAPGSLPLVDGEFLKAVRDKFVECAERRGWKAETYKEALSLPEADAEIDALLSPTQRPVGLTIEEAKRYIADTDPADYDAWLEVGMALHFEFGGSVEALALWDEWSSRAANYKGFSDLQYRWERFGSGAGRRRVTMRTIIARFNSRHCDAALELNGKGIAARAANYYRPGLIYDRGSENWFCFNSVHWSVVDQVFVESAMWPVLQDLLYKELQATEPDSSERKRFYKFYQTSQNYFTLSSTVKLLRTWEGMSVGDLRRESKPRYFGVANGDIDLETGALLSPAVSRYTMEASSVAFDPSARCPLWEQTVSEAFNGDTEMAAFLQRIAGYAMLGEPVEEVMFVFTGNGCNGKSTIVNAIREILGQSACTVEAETFTTTGGGAGGAGGARADLLAVFGKRFVVLPETDENARLKEATVKRMVSRDEVTARGLYKSRPESVKPSWVVGMVTNYMPLITGDDEGIHRRIAVVPFNRNFDKDPGVKKDTRRAEKLRKEYPGILNWMLEGVKEYRRVGLAYPAVVKSKMVETRSAMDVLGEFISERCVLGADQSCDTASLWNAWVQFARANGYEHAIKTKTALTQRLAKRGVYVKVANKKVNGAWRSVRVYVGISPAEDALSQSDSDDDFIE